MLLIVNGFGCKIEIDFLAMGPASRFIPLVQMVTVVKATLRSVPLVQMVRVVDPPMTIDKLHLST